MHTHLKIVHKWALHFSTLALNLQSCFKQQIILQHYELQWSFFNALPPI